MDQYRNLVKNIIEKGNYRPNRTGIDTVSTFSQSYSIDVSEGFPLLTTKDMSGYRYNSLIHEILWYFSGEEHIRNLREETKIWDAWADEKGQLPTAYGRFWRRYPIPENQDLLDGEWWPTNTQQWIEEAKDDYNLTEKEIKDGISTWVNEENGHKTFDQLQYVLDSLEENPHSRRLVVDAWHPANAAVSTLPPCHYTFVFNVQGDRLNVHLTQRSGDVALGIPFNLAAYSLLAHAVANRTEFEVGSFGHTIVDAHVYCGEGERGEWYAEHLPALQERLTAVGARTEYGEVRAWLEETAPPEPGEEGYDHVPGLLTQLSREPRQRPTIEVADRPLDALEYDDVRLHGYDPAPGLEFAVAE